MTQVKRQLNFPSAEQADRMDNVVRTLGFKNRSQMAQHIADRSAAIVPTTDEMKGALVASAIALHNQGHPGVGALIQLIESISPKGDPALAQVQALKDPDLKPWVTDAVECIRARRPFKLEFHGKTRILQYAELAYHEGRQYIHGWLSKPAEDADLPELARNRLFWTGEADAQVLPASSQSWHEEGLDSVKATFRVGFRYRPKPQDISVQPVGDEWTRVETRVTNLLWFYQKMLRYSGRVVVENPIEIQTGFMVLLKEQLELQSEGFMENAHY